MLALRKHVYQNKAVIQSLAGSVSIQNSGKGNVSAKTFCISSVNRLKRIEEREEGNVTIVEGIKIQSKREGHVLPTCADSKGCPLCPHRLGEKLDLHYTDVLILSQFLRSDGCMLPGWVTGLCKFKQREVANLVNKAQRAGLMPELRPANPNGNERTNLRSNYKWKKYNVFFEET